MIYDYLKYLHIITISKWYIFKCIIWLQQHTFMLFSWRMSGSLKCILFITRYNTYTFSNTWTVNFLMFKLVLEKAEEPEIRLPTSAGSWKKQDSSRKTSISALLTMPKTLTVWITRNCGKFWKRWEYQTTWPASWETYMQVRKQQLELDLGQQTGSIRKRSMSRLYIVTLLI